MYIYIHIRHKPDYTILYPSCSLYICIPDPIMLCQDRGRRGWEYSHYPQLFWDFSWYLSHAFGLWGFHGTCTELVIPSGKLT